LMKNILFTIQDLTPLIFTDPGVSDTKRAVRLSYAQNPLFSGDLKLKAVLTIRLMFSI
jgi:hypothetical protein